MTDMTLWRTCLWCVQLSDASFHGWADVTIINDVVTVQSYIGTYMSPSMDPSIKEQLSILVNGFYDPDEDSSYTWGKHDPWTFQDTILDILRARGLAIDDYTKNPMTMDGVLPTVYHCITTLSHHVMIARSLVRDEDHTDSEPDDMILWELVQADQPSKIVETMSHHPAWLDDLSAALLSPVLIPDLSP